MNGMPQPKNTPRVHRSPNPQQLHTWYNVFDRMDVIAVGTSRVIDTSSPLCSARDTRSFTAYLSHTSVYC